MKRIGIITGGVQVQDPAEVIGILKQIAAEFHWRYMDDCGPCTAPYSPDDWEGIIEEMMKHNRELGWEVTLLRGDPIKVCLTAESIQRVAGLLSSS